MSGADELLEQFIIEGRELLGEAGDDLARLGRDGADRPALDRLFRHVHTLKGSSALFELPALTALLHATESLLEAARDEGAASREVLTTALRAADLTEAWLDALEGGAPTDDVSEKTAEALARLHGGPADEDAGAPEADDGWARALVGGLASGRALVAIRYTPAAEAYFRGDDPLATIHGVPELVKLELSAAADAGPAYDPFRCSLVVHAVSAAPLAEVRAALRLVAAEVEVRAAAGGVAAPAAPADLSLRSLRVDAARLDDLAALTDELVIAKNALIHETARLGAAAGANRSLANAQAALERLVTDIHGAVTGLRMVALRHVFARLPRQVRETAQALGKDVELVISGDQVAVDKSAVERLYEPLLHLARNALDHGIEPPAVRRAAGKPPRATLNIAAQARGDEVTIDVSDDGRGIDADRVRRAAVARGVLSDEAAGELSDEAAADLIFAAGFSTAGEVSGISGRGVGMDAVRAAVTELGGRVALINRPGEGLTVRLSLPAHVVLTKILVVKAGGERFGVPLDAVAETHRVTPAQVTHIRAGRAYVRRDTVIPLMRLTDLLGVRAGPDGDVFPVLNLVGGGDPVGIQIEEIGERVEAPVRPMSGLLAAYPGVMGAVLQGDGQVLLVLDLAELAA